VYGTGSTLVPEHYEVNGQYAIRTGRLWAREGGSILMDGGIVRVGSNLPQAMYIGYGSKVEGWGSFMVYGNSPQKLVNNGLIRVTISSMHFNGGDGGFDFGGSNGTGVVEVTDDRTFTVNGPLTETTSMTSWKSC
jgi:hypothetical protein